MVTPIDSDMTDDFYGPPPEPPPAAAVPSYLGLWELSVDGTAVCTIPVHVWSSGPDLLWVTQDERTEGVCPARVASRRRNRSAATWSRR